MRRYFIGLIATFGLIIILILLLFSGGGSKSKSPSAPRTLDSYAASDAEVVMTIDGPINAAQTHQQVRISVGQDETTFEQLQGYDGSVVNFQSFPNTEASYSVFLHALTGAGYRRGNSSQVLSDERGYCPLGDRYIFELNQEGSDITRYWGSSCGSPKTYLGNTNLTVTLFEAQVPSYATLTENFRL